jgi:hypothetical protein
MSEPKITDDVFNPEITGWTLNPTYIDRLLHTQQIKITFKEPGKAEKGPYKKRFHMVVILELMGFKITPTQMITGDIFGEGWNVWINFLIICISRNETAREWVKKYIGAYPINDGVIKRIITCFKGSTPTDEKIGILLWIMDLPRPKSGYTVESINNRDVIMGIIKTQCNELRRSTAVSVPPMIRPRSASGPDRHQRSRPTPVSASASVPTDVKGIKNSGGSFCWMNASLQCFYSCPAIYNWLLTTCQTIGDDNPLYKLQILAVGAMMGYLDTKTSNPNALYKKYQRAHEVIYWTNPSVSQSGFDDSETKDCGDIIHYLFAPERGRTPNPDIISITSYSTMVPIFRGEPKIRVDEVQTEPWPNVFIPKRRVRYKIGDSIYSFIDGQDAPAESSQMKYKTLSAGCLSTNGMREIMATEQPTTYLSVNEATYKTDDPSFNDIINRCENIPKTQIMVSPLERQDIVTDYKISGNTLLCPRILKEETKTLWKGTADWFIMNLQKETTHSHKEVISIVRDAMRNGIRNKDGRGYVLTGCIISVAGHYKAYCRVGNSPRFLLFNDSVVTDPSGSELKSVLSNVRWMFFSASDAGPKMVRDPPFTWPPVDMVPALWERCKYECGRLDPPIDVKIFGNGVKFHSRHAIRYMVAEIKAATPGITDYELQQKLKFLFSPSSKKFSLLIY